MNRTLSVLLTVAVLLALSPAVSRANFDVFDSETVNDRDAFGLEIPYTSGAARQFTVSFDTSAFGLDAGEDAASSSNVNGCLESPAVFAGRTAWARFNPGVDGRLRVVAQTPGYDSIVWIREARKATWQTATFSDVRGRDNNCSDINDAAGDEETVFPTVAGAAPAKKENAYYVQVGGKCPTGLASCADPSVPGGPTTIRLTFTPDDADSDGVPDSNDACTPEGRAGSVTANGCADEDRDGIRDSEEGPGCVGQQGVGAAAPYNGCFDGPNPPDPALGPSVVIEGADGDTDNTADTAVFLRLNWPKGAREAFANNSAGDPPVSIALQARVPWTLRPSAKSAVREVEVRFRGPGIDAKDEDTITLDPTPPTISKTLLFKSAPARWFVGVRASDDPAGTGVLKLDVLDRRSKLIKSLTVCRKAPCKRTVTDDLRRLRTTPVFVRASDAAGNLSTKRKLIARSNRGCKIQMPAGVVPKCLRENMECRKIKPPNISEAVARVTCVGGRLKLRNRLR